MQATYRQTFYPINYEKSILKQRIIYKTTIGFVFSRIMDYLLMLMFISCVTIPVIIKPKNVSHISIYYYLFCIAFDGWIILNAIFLNVLVKINGLQKEINKRDVITILSEGYKLNNLDSSNDDIITDIRLTGIFRAGRLITCLFDNDIVYINIIRLLRYDGFSFFSGLYLYYKCKSLAKKFKLLQKANSQTAN